MASGTIVIDPGHGGNVEVGGSSANNAISPSGVLEKNMTLRMAMLVRDALAKLATEGNHNLTVRLTRETDKNVGLADRAAMAASAKADIFLSIHFNASEQHKARGVETLVSPKDRNSNHADDVALATRVQSAVFNAIKAHDAHTRDRRVKDQALAHNTHVNGALRRRLRVGPRLRDLVPVHWRPAPRRAARAVCMAGPAFPEALTTR